MTPQMERLITNFQETCQQAKPVTQELTARWHEHQGFLQGLRFLISMNTDASAQEQKQVIMQNFDQLINDMNAAFALLNTYYHLGIAIGAILQEYGDEK